MENNQFFSLCIHSYIKAAAKEVYYRFPEKVRKKVDKNFIHVTDIYYESTNPNVKIHKEPLGLYKDGERSLHIIPKQNIFSKYCLKGTIVHETAHACIYFTPYLIKKISRLYYRVKLFLANKYTKILYCSSREPFEELHADSLARKLGFSLEIDELNRERTTFV